MDGQSDGRFFSKPAWIVSPAAFCSRFKFYLLWLSFFPTIIVFFLFVYYGKHALVPTRKPAALSCDGSYRTDSKSEGNLIQCNIYYCYWNFFGSFYFVAILKNDISVFANCFFYVSTFLFAN
jgi:hypothetical protein